MQNKVRTISLAIMDVVLIHLGFIIALLLRFDGNIDQRYQQLYVKDVLSLSVIMLATFFAFKLHKSLWRYASVRELMQVVGACLLGDIVLFGFNCVQQNLFPISIYFMYPIILIGCITGTRVGYRMVRRILMNRKVEEKDRQEELTPPERIMLVGAGDAASIIIKDNRTSRKNNEQIIVAVDDDVLKNHNTINGIPIKGEIKEIPELAKKYNINQIIITMPSVSKRRIAEILEVCSQTTCKLKIFPGINGAINEAGAKPFIRDVQIEDLLGREEIVLENNKLKYVVKDKVVLVTGGGGSIGSELCRQIIHLKPKKLIIFDIYENNAYDLQMELMQEGVPKEKIEVLIGSVRDLTKLKEVFSEYRPQLVFHAAAHKHVPLMEDSPEEAIKNNVFGTLNTAQCAVEFKVEKFVLISTDKAVNPTSVMGATKRICEMIIQAINETTSSTDFVAVRFGNVLGSNGSVIPLFKRQLQAGGPLTVTHPEIIRYFMTIPEAVRLILEATTFAKGGEIFVLDMGKPVKILDLAKNFIRLSGYEEGKDIDIIFTGLRPGEKLYEELLMAEEGLEQTVSDKIFIGKPSHIKYAELIEALHELKAGVERGQDVRKLLQEVVPTYKWPEEQKVALA